MFNCKTGTRDRCESLRSGPSLYAQALGGMSPNVGDMFDRRHRLISLAMAMT